MRVVAVYKSFEICKLGSGFTVEYEGDEIYFGSVEEAMDFIDSL